MKKGVSVKGKKLKPEEAWKSKNIIKVEPAQGSSRNPDAWGLPDSIDIRNSRENEVHLICKVAPGRWKREVYIDHELVKTEFVEDCPDLLKKDYSRLIGLADCGSYMADFTPGKGTGWLDAQEED